MLKREISQQKNLHTKLVRKPWIDYLHQNRVEINLRLDLKLLPKNIHQSSPRPPNNRKKNESKNLQLKLPLRTPL